MLENVAVVLLDGFAAFEFGVLCEVFGTDRSDDGLPGYDFAVVAGEPGPLRSGNGFTLQTPHGLDRLAEADLIRLAVAIARRVVELLGDRVVREVAWEVVPEMAERLVRARLQELAGA